MAQHFKETQPYEEGFANYFETKLVPLLHKVEKHRKASLKRFIILAILCVITVVIAPMVIYSIFGDELGRLGILIIAIVGSYYVLDKTIKDFKDIAIAETNELLAQFYGNFNYKREYNLPNKIIKEIDFVLPVYNEIYYEDLFYGEHNGNQIEFCETQIERIRLNSETNNKEVVFKGLFVILTFQKSLAGKTSIIKKSGKLINFVKKTPANTEKVELKNKDFNKLYKVYTTNLTETNALLSNMLLHRIMKLAENFNCKNISCCFYDNKAFLAIPVKKNLFESVSLFQSAFNEKKYKSFLKDFNQILKISETISEQLLEINNNHLS